jgi:hypothetical protein
MAAVADRVRLGGFRRWLDLGLLDPLLREVARRRRRKLGRRPGPSLGIIDTQVVKCVAARGPRGYDAGKKVLGRKRVALVDAEGYWLAVAVVPASVQDRDALEALDAGKAGWPTLREGVYDGAFAAERCRAWSNRHGMRHRVVARDPARRRGALSCSRAAGWSRGASAGCPAGAASPGTGPGGSTSPPRGSPSPVSSPASRPCSTRCRSAPAFTSTTQTGS